ncbi:bifunctional adenosylcobinamide kinase/adenosylcobinamide-phosphate guanylyltransferase [Sphingomonas sp. 37zxx]|uniref:bifunctional adenosylcobinamide kinase/adenosylcobinamide-phosphate guanylyltransferase n=1 Tax=Sphingomonas sp. 37zxx TaxID=1550073 RepID=UPI00053BE090|nr:bifunctional adenosylcobinamide kinase/adenosylcobinamide-phosphate guanylyltransferase [Sphingomonas sp. 37zxx]
MNNVHFFVGGARSGKSRLAQAAAEALPGSLVYLATAQAFDAEMTDRIARHIADRGARWRTVECPLDLPAAIVREGDAGSVLLIDCLTLWLTNVMLGDHPIEPAVDALVAALAAVSCPVMLVSNEVGMGIVPENTLARRFRDEAGRLNQRVATAAGSVSLVAAGLALQMK